MRKKQFEQRIVSRLTNLLALPGLERNLRITNRLAIRYPVSQ
jgi:hypothetical protein